MIIFIDRSVNGHPGP